MLPVVLIVLAMGLTLAAVLAGRCRPAALARSVARPLAGPPGERVVAVMRPDPEVGLSMAALGAAGFGLVLVLAALAFGAEAGLPLALALGVFALPLAADWAGQLRRAWVLTDRRLIAGRGLEVPLADLTRVRILPLAVEIEARGARRLRLPALANPTVAGRVIHAAALARARSGPRVEDGFPPARP
jgi:hypothetical protein